MKIAICGKMGTGKSSLANYINDNYFKKKGLIASFASPIKQIHTNPSLAIDYFLQKFNGTAEYLYFCNVINKLNKNNKQGKPRKQYQFIGEYFCDNFNKSFWVDKFFYDYEEHKKIQKALKIDINNNLIIDDLRKNVEYDYLIKNNFIIIGLEILECERIKIIKKDKLCDLNDLNSINHSTETQVDNIINNLKMNSLKNYYEFESNRRIIINKKINKILLNIIFDYFS